MIRVAYSLRNDVRERARRIRREMPKRFALLRARWRLMLRLALAVSLSLMIAVNLLHHEQAFFAPIAAAITVLVGQGVRVHTAFELVVGVAVGVRSEEHTSELQSRFDLVCRLLLEKKKHTH